MTLRVIIGVRREIEGTNLVNLVLVYKICKTPYKLMLYELVHLQ